ncbi:MAG: M48 family metallopeptidase [Sphingobium sp.]
MIEVNVWHYDGRNANRWQPRLLGDSEGFRLLGDDWEAGPYRWADLVALDNAGPDAVFGHVAEQGWRLGFAADVPADVAALLPQRPRYGGFIDRVGLWRASAALACVAALVLFVGIKAPGWVAPFVPQSWEDNLGDAMVGDFGGRYCHTPEGDAALRALVGKIDPEGHARSIEVANIRMVNAIALPGRRIILFTDLVEKAESPDEVAGVLGHELGHVEHRDTLTALMRQLGLSVILGGLDGSGGTYLNTALGLSFSREAEHKADLAAIDSLKAANISPRPTATFFQRLGGVPDKEGGKKSDQKAKGDVDSTRDRIEQATGWLASHPTSRSRYELFDDAAEKGHSYTSALTARQWEALKNMCVDDRTVKSDRDFWF